MKIRFWDRLILFFGALLAVVVGVFLVIGGLQFTGVLGEALPLGTRIGCIASGVLLAAFGVYLFAFPRSYASGRHDFIVQQTDNGELRIAVKAIENLVQKCVDMHEEIRLDAMKIRNAREGVTVDLSISLANNISIPLAVASLQKQIKQYLVASSGIEVKEVRVSVETAGGDEAGDSPYLVGEEQNQEKAVEKPAQEQNKAKVPLHQRIFGKPEQAVTVPEPPKAEEPAAEDAAEEPVTEEAPAEDTPAPAEAAPEEAESEESLPDDPSQDGEALPQDTEDDDHAQDAPTDDEPAAEEEEISRKEQEDAQ
ncbi:MAG: alkaline shock response membrane anchor protein AmaP [Clostridia bacterium]|nr:alkaline shock response membrane anchor protein AmaP [Clostridia bacterium]